MQDENEIKTAKSRVLYHSSVGGTPLQPLSSHGHDTPGGASFSFLPPTGGLTWARHGRGDEMRSPQTPEHPPAGLTSTQDLQEGHIASLSVGRKTLRPRWLHVGKRVLMSPLSRM